ncbi:hypothetical protein [Pseudanabaena sp. FACHB-2040]|uniref:hypothetical protein n=1 Tax=Pseudanabaena sp. FACHB-2040 TaxID=2692859 RepID=UPI001684D754|nr:hypothetical protein [Pseudanabaena sp. FACHB-2040]MBD2257824.1 hypothetical protein [Pseudanabaena sp. FACHB-2040]
MKLNQTLKLAVGSLTLLGMAAILPAQSLAQSNPAGSGSSGGSVGDVYRDDVRPEESNTPNTNPNSAPNNTPNTIQRIDGSGSGNTLNNGGMNRPGSTTNQTGFPDRMDTAEAGDVGDVYNSNMGPERSNVMRLQRGY